MEDQGTVYVTSDEEPILDEDGFWDSPAMLVREWERRCAIEREDSLRTVRKWRADNPEKWAQLASMALGWAAEGRTFTMDDVLEAAHGAKVYTLSVYVDILACDLAAEHLELDGHLILRDPHITEQG